MTLGQLNEQTMFADVLQYLDDNAPEWNKNSVVSAGVSAFRVAKKEVDAKTQLQQDSDKTGYTSKKNTDFENMLNLAYRTSVRVHNYAINAGDLVMANTVDFSKNSLADGTEAEVTMRCTTIATSASTALAATPAPNTDYKITQAGITDLQAAIALITPDTAKRNVVSGAHTDATATIAKLISTAKNKLYSLDRLIEGMVEDDEDDFITGYEVIRKINNRRGRGAAKPATT